MILFSICIPSYNRGHRAYQLVKKLMPLLDEYPEIEIILSNNGSTKNVEGYELIKEMNCDRLLYNEFSENKYYWGNVNQVLKMSRGRYAMLLSDEDEIVEDAVSYYLELCKSNQNTGLIRSNTSKMYNHIGDDYGKRGIDAIKKFYLKNNYLSGIIYNRTVLTDEIIDELYEKYKNNIAYRYYVHEILDSYCLLKGDFYSSGVRLIEEGKAENEDSSDDNGGYASYESRLGQQRGFVEIVKDMDCASEIEKAFMFIEILQKTLTMFDIINSITKDQSAEKFAEMVLKFRDQSIDDMDYLDLNVIKQDRDVWINSIMDLVRDVIGESR